MNDQEQPTTYTTYTMASDQRSTINKIFEASKNGEVDTLKSLLATSTNASDLVLEMDEESKTALHYALNKDIAQMLVEAVEPDHQVVLVLFRSSSATGVESVRSDRVIERLVYSVTALDAAVSNNRADVVKYLCDLAPADEWVHHLKNLPSGTALHYAESAQVARIVVESVQANRLTAFLLRVDVEHQQTALHFAAKYPGVEDIIEYLCSLSATELLLCQDENGNTALHLATTSETVQILIEGLPEPERKDFVFIRNNEKKTALHVNVMRWEAEVSNISYYFTSLPYIDELAFAKDVYGRTALYYANTGEIASSLIDAVKNKLSYLNVTDNEGNTAIMYLALGGRTAALQYTLQYIDDECSSSYLKNSLLMTNKNGQNIFHLASISPANLDAVEELREYVAEVKIEDLLAPDAFDNTPITYLVATFSTSSFAEFILRIPMWERRKCLSKRNQRGITCISISQQKQFIQEFYLQSILCTTDNLTYFDLFETTGQSDRITSAELIYPERLFKYDEDIFRVMKYAMNEYSLSDLQISTNVADAARHEQASTMTHDGQPNPTPKTVLLWFYFDTGVLTISEIQKKLYSLDVSENHGKPKVVVVTSLNCDKDSHASPPGPDFIIITVSLHAGSQMFLNQQQMMQYADIDDLLTYLKIHPSVECININSTMGRHYGVYNTQSTEDRIMLLGESKGRALIICNTHNREKWEVDHKQACSVLGQQFGLEVESQYNKASEEMLRAIAEFSKSSGHSSLVALTIMSHGDELGNIFGNDGLSTCAVQEVIDALCQPELQNVIKVIFLSFCRGGIGRPRSNRTNESFECARLPRLANIMSFNAVRRGVSKAQLNKERQLHPFPSVVVPVNCYICYSTLPDSKSFRGNTMLDEYNRMFEGLSAYLTGLYRSSSPETTDTCTYTAGLVEDSAMSSPKHSHPPRVELVSLLIDVSGFVREKSDFTQYLNYCYTITKTSKPVFVEILPFNIL